MEVPPTTEECQNSRDCREIRKLTSTDEIGPTGSVDEANIPWKMGIKPIEELAA